MAITSTRLGCTPLYMRPPSMVNISRPYGVVVSAQASLSERKPAPRLDIASMTFQLSVVIADEDRHGPSLNLKMAARVGAIRLPVCRTAHIGLISHPRPG
jgi:hypothetical protein